MPAWMDIVGRTIPTTLRGRFFGSANLVASVGGLLGSVVTAWLLARFSPPQSYGLCFLGGFVFLVVSYVALSTVREPAGPRPASHVSLGSYLRRMPSLLRRDSNLSWFLVARGLGTLGMMANGFYTVYALRTWQAAEWQVGVFTTLFLAGQVIGNLGMGWLADRAGHRLVLVLGVGALAVGNLVALRAISPETLGPVFALAGIHVAAIHVSSRTILLELAADEGERPTYLGLVNTALAPLNFAGPLVAGLIADRLGFSTVFALAAVFGATGVALLLARVREPRWAGQRAT
jgi:MFS family permease